MISFQIDDPIFKTKPLFVMNCTHPQLDRYLKKHFHMSAGLDCNQHGQMFTFERAPDPTLRIVWVQHTPTTPERLGTLLHEIFHLTTRICQDKGVPIKAQIDEGNGDETAAYLFDYFAREACRRSGLFRKRTE